MRKELSCQRMRRRMVLVVALRSQGRCPRAGHGRSRRPVRTLLRRRPAPAGRVPPRPQANFFADPFGLNQQQAAAPAPRVAGSGPAFCVRSCDGKYFSVTTRGNATPVQMCQAFCPASVTKVYYGSNIDMPPPPTANATRAARTPLPTARRSAPTAPATAAILPALPRSI